MPRLMTCTIQEYLFIMRKHFNMDSSSNQRYYILDFGISDWHYQPTLKVAVNPERVTHS